MQRYISAHAMVCAERPEAPVYCHRPDLVNVASRWFQENFPGQVFFAVKTNPFFVDTLARSGLCNFDVASLAEIELVANTCPGARMAFMHPIKSRNAIQRAYFDYGVRDFALDSEAEFDKILVATGRAEDLNLFLRIAVSNRYSCLNLAGKFGVTGDAAARLLFKVRQKARRVGLCFHAGSQLMNPDAYVHAMESINKVIFRSGVIVDVLDIGGGFPSVYPGLNPPPLIDYIKRIKDQFERTPVSETCELWCEPGRALVAEGSSLLVRVDSRKDNTLHINDGTYGGLFDAGQPGFRFPAVRIREQESYCNNLTPFCLFGPTCDSLDYMPGPFLLPEDIAEGDYIEIGNLGAYSMQLRTGFNGFGGFEQVQVDDGPILSLYGMARDSRDDSRLAPFQLAGEESNNLPGDI